jgi:hypothetical protein
MLYNQMWNLFATNDSINYIKKNLKNQIVDFTSQIVGWRGVSCPTNKGVSYTNLMCWLGCDLKNRLLLLLL